MLAKLKNGQLENIRMPIKTEEQDIFTNDENVLRGYGYKNIVYTETPSEAAIPHWEETDSDIIQVWETTEEVSE